MRPTGMLSMPVYNFGKLEGKVREEAFNKLRWVFSNKQSEKINETLGETLNELDYYLTNIYVAIDRNDYRINHAGAEGYIERGDLVPLVKRLIKGDHNLFADFNDCLAMLDFGYKFELVREGDEDKENVGKHRVYIVMSENSDLSTMPDVADVLDKVGLLIKEELDNSVKELVDKANDNITIFANSEDEFNQLNYNGSDNTVRGFINLNNIYFTKHGHIINLNSYSDEGVEYDLHYNLEPEPFKVGVNHAYKVQRESYEEVGKKSSFKRLLSSITGGRF